VTKIVLHIGAEKTGSTSLQATLANNAALLYSRCGLLYPTEPPLGRWDAHFPVAAAFLDLARCNFVDLRWRLPIAELRASLAATIARKQPRILVLSAEHFSSRFLPAEIAELAAFLAPYPVEVVYYARRQDELAISGFGTSLVSGSRHWFNSAWIQPKQRYFDHARIADDWASVFGTANLRLRDYADLAKSGLAEDFLSQTGISPPPLESSVRRNEAISVLEAQVLHAVNQHLPTWAEALERNEPDAYLDAQRYRRRLIQAMRQTPKFSDSPPVTALLGQRERLAILERFAASNARLGEAYGVRFATGAEERTDAASLGPLEPALVGLLVAQLREQDRQLAANDRLYDRAPAAMRAWLELPAKLMKRLRRP
jgi:hypothetical protein